MANGDAVIELTLHDLHVHICVPIKIELAIEGAVTGMSSQG
jgi:hypothetical protein